MSASVTATISATSVNAPSTAARTTRDLRLDFFRGIALLLIFIDHVSGNRFAALTLQNMGFADAAEVFVFIAGLSAVYAFRGKFRAGLSRDGLMAIGARLRTLYLAHLGMFLGVLAFASLAVEFGTGFDIIGKLGLQPLLDDPQQALTRAIILGYLPHYLDILPLYVLLLASLPLIFLGFRLHVLLPLATAALIYLLTQVHSLNLMNFGHEAGWFLNPFAWLIIFVAGATVAELAARNMLQALPRWSILATTFAATAYVMFAFAYAAPWRVFPALEALVIISAEFEPDKAFASWHRLVDISAKAWLAAILIPSTAAFMARGLGGAISRAGRNSLPLFISGTFLSLAGSIILFEADGHALAHIGVTAGGVVLMLLQAAWLEGQSVARSATVVKTRSVAGRQPA